MTDKIRTTIRISEETWQNANKILDEGHEDMSASELIEHLLHMYYMCYERNNGYDDVVSSVDDHLDVFVGSIRQMMIASLVSDDIQAYVDQEQGESLSSVQGESSQGDGSESSNDRGMESSGLEE